MGNEIGRSIHIPFGHSAKGDIVSNPSVNSGFYIRKSAERISVVPTTSYCLSCSAINEYDKRTGKVRPKYELQEYDLVFDLSYREEDGELYGKCDNCGFDVRGELDENQLYEEPKKEMAYRDIIVDKPLYRNGNYYVAVEDFANVAKEYAKGSRIKLCIEQKIGPKINKYRMSDTAFNELRTFDKSSKGLLGIPRKLWERSV
tara:strand:+ start:189 stop:794 length:606 start_codon:yes stop_codon:yes gene_type:complete